LHFIRLFHVRDPIQGAGSLSGISRDRCQRLPHRYRVVRMAPPCVRRLLETAGRSLMCLCTAQWPLLHACLERWTGAPDALVPRCRSLRSTQWHS
jgi:hypothetical protein